MQVSLMALSTVVGDNTATTAISAGNTGKGKSTLRQMRGMMHCLLYEIEIFLPWPILYSKWFSRMFWKDSNFILPFFFCRNKREVFLHFKISYMKAILTAICIVSLTYGVLAQNSINNTIWFAHTDISISADIQLVFKKIVYLF